MSAQSIPNLLGVFRIVATPLLYWFIATATPAGYIAAAVLLLLMAISDIVDGRLARSLNVVSPLGVFLDTTSDKIFVTAALIPMVSVGLLPGWIAAVIIIRDFAVSGLRSYAAAEGVVIAARPWGKQKLTLTVLALLWLLLDAALGGSAYATETTGIWRFLAFIGDGWVLMMALALIWTIGSGIEYFWNARHLLLGQESPEPAKTSKPA